jgi:hypothetical protein
LKQDEVSAYDANSKQLQSTLARYARHTHSGNDHSLAHVSHELDAVIGSMPADTDEKSRIGLELLHRAHELIEEEQTIVNRDLQSLPRNHFHNLAKA